MQNKPQVMNQKNQTEIPDWLYEVTQEDDFLVGKRQQDLQDIWEDEE